MTQPFGEPWYAPARKKGSAMPPAGAMPRPPRASLFGAVLKLLNGVVGFVLTLGAGFCFGQASGPGAPPGADVLLWLGGAVLSVAALFFLVRQGGVLLSLASDKQGDVDPFSLALSALRGELQLDDSRKGVPAPEMALLQFVQQVRAYATEKSYQKNRQDGGGAGPVHNPLVAEPVDLLKRRWNEVLDSLGEFEIYLANDPQGMIQKLISKYPNQTIDVSQVFRDVAESFDNTWRRKGINIEAAIVTPLRANTNEALLRRLLVGPWRSCAYFAKRGGGVLFSAKSLEGRVVARWECEGLSIHDDYLKFAMQSHIPVNERIEKGLQVLAPDPNSPNTLHALISFITWIDLAQTVAADFAFKHTNDGFVVELRLK
ncbi:MAG: hypothetical protein IOD12_15770 [Silvanigrellales bacterium]|jgi:hypothetical protein|nr:hypothetical protein [Silvanigrellales bacterium]